MEILLIAGGSLLLVFCMVLVIGFYIRYRTRSSERSQYESIDTPSNVPTKKKKKPPFYLNSQPTNVSEY